LSSSLGLRCNESKCIVNDNASSPGMCPSAQSCVVFGRYIETRHNTLFGPCSISSKEIGQEIKPSPILWGCPSSLINCCVLCPAAIRSSKGITILHVLVLLSAVAKDENPLHQQLRALASLSVRRCDETPSHFNSCSSSRPFVHRDLPSSTPLHSELSYWDFRACGVSLSRTNSCANALISRSTVFTANCPKTISAPRFDCG